MADDAGSHALNFLTGRTDGLPPASCAELATRPLVEDMCYACMAGQWTAPDGSGATWLNGCSLNGGQASGRRCGIFSSCRRDARSVTHRNDRYLYVATCRLDPLRIATFSAGMLAAAFLLAGIVVLIVFRGVKARGGTQLLVATSATPTTGRTPAAATGQGVGAPTPA